MLLTSSVMLTGPVSSAPASDREISRKYDRQPVRSMLFVGGPGTGKTHMARAIAAELQSDSDADERWWFLPIKPGELLSMWYGESERNIREVFRAANEMAAREGTAGVVLDLGEQGAVAFYNGLDGSLTRFALTPTAAEDLSVSGNGAVVALVRPEQTFFYALGE